MNLFEKIHNYQIITRLDESQIYPITAMDKTWLKTMLGLPDAQQFFTKETYAKLQELLKSHDKLPLEEVMVEKAKSKEKALYHQHLGPLRKIIQKKNFVQLTTKTRRNQIYPVQIGIPYKLEYSMTKKQWYLIWINKHYSSILYTPLDSIIFIEEIEETNQNYDTNIKQMLKRIEARKQTAKIIVLPEYNAEISRILHAFSCFEKELSFDEATRTYTITLIFVDEGEYILSKIRFLGQRVKIIENNYLIRRMRESAHMAIERYTK